MDYYKKYIKYKTKYLQLGGRINWHVHSPIAQVLTVVIPISEVRERRNNTQAITTEVCGKYVAEQCINNNGTACLLKCHSIINEDPDSFDRPNCIVHDKNAFGILWHTHPVGSKFYPSAEDIISINKIRGPNSINDTIKLSIIYTNVGVWLIKPGNYKRINPNDTEAIKLDTQKINDVNKVLYKQFGNGRPQVITEESFNYIQNNYLPNMLLLDYKVEFVPYENIPGEGLQVIVHNIREDALTE
jgi:hypothetical protein